ncbi:leucine-binding protein (LBP) [Afipia sp. P52-10]|nr:ABC transporter substrate-binding protein [Afipia sp. P52-10]ETR74751.1 leucine-binding protein (LBP) [Afipia sp. P52-10]
MIENRRRAGGLVAAAMLLATPAFAQTKTTNQGITATEIVVGTHQDLSGPLKTAGVPIANGLKLAAEEINASGGIHGRKIRLVIEDSGYDPKRALLATQKMIERDKIFSLIGALGSPTVMAGQDILLDAGITQLFPGTAAEFTYKFDPAKPQERLKFNNLLPYVESTRAAMKYMVETFKPQKSCIMYQDDEYGKNVLEGFEKQLAAMNLKPATITSYKRGAADFSSQISKMKADGCDLVMLGTVIRETVGAMIEVKKNGWDNAKFLASAAANFPDVHVLGKDAVEGLYAAAAFEVPYEDTAKGRVKDWITAYKKAFGSDANTQAVIGYNAMMTFAHYAKLAGKDLTGQKLLDALESGDVYQDIFGSAPTKFSKTNHLASTVTQVQKIENGRWVVVKGGLVF